MNFKKFSILLILLIAMSLTCVSAASDDGAVGDGAVYYEVNNEMSNSEMNSVGESTGQSALNFNAGTYYGGSLNVASNTAVQSSGNSVITGQASENEAVSQGNDDILGDGVGSVSDIQSKIDSASDGGIVDLGTNKVYNVYKEQITINKKITLTGNNVTIIGSASYGVISIRSASDITICGITFQNPVDLPNYGNRTFSGKAIYTQASKNIVVDNCKFINYAYGVEFTSSTQYSTVKNSWFNGATTGVSGYSGSGTKAIQLMGSKNINIINNTFYGQIYDALSIASGSGNVIIENNEFINNTFAIFYGGASTEGNKITNNKFITCGMINTTYYNDYTKQTYVIYFDDLPYIGLQKASNDIEIKSNEFSVKSNNLIIYSEAENTAHGYPSTYGGINITDNLVKKADENVSNIVFYHLKVDSSLSLNPTDDVVIKNNNFTDIEDVNNFKFEFASIETQGNDITIPKGKIDTYLAVDYVKDGRVIIALYNLEGVEIAGQSISYTINGGETQTATTNEYGYIYIDNLEGSVNLDVAFKGNDDYYASSLSATLQLSVVQAPTQITASAFTVYAIKAKSTYYKFTLKDSTGNPLAEKEVTVSFNGVLYTVKTDTNGVGSFKIPIATAGKYQTTISFTGDSEYKGSVAVSTIKISKQATKLTVAKKTFKKSATKKVTAVLKDSSGKALSGKKVTMKVNGKTYTAKTNSKGVATFTVKITKKGTFTATTKFAGDSYYTAKSATSKIIVK